MTAKAGSLGARLRKTVPSWGQCVVELDHVDSTNSLALALGREGAPEGSVVVAQSQRHGRGRWSRVWESPGGGLYFTLMLRPVGKKMPLTLLPLLVSVATVEGLSRTGLDVRLQWPNDLYVDGRKLAGILCESSFSGGALDFVVAGVGVNVNQTASQFPGDVQARATSLRLLLGLESDRYELLVEILARLSRSYEQDDSESMLGRFRSYADGLSGAAVRFESRTGETIDAVTDGIAADGGLKVTLGDGTRRVLYSEDVHRLRE